MRQIHTEHLYITQHNP